MPRLLAVVVLVVLPLAGSSAPVPKSIKSQKAPVVEGTTWAADHTAADLGRIDYTFLPDGKLTFRYANGQTYTEGSWRQDGDQLYFDVNKRYAEYTVTYRDRRFEGEAKNVVGKTWTLTMTRTDGK